ncbi:hypothetical protein C2E23DRAFT_888857 [Lenzites betulinus]|nr:hypothetical protein C2E23DRAFT_888857 [Lenzites betulinus]
MPRLLTTLRPPFLPLLLALLSGIVSLPFSAGALTNRTIDDEKGDSVTGAMPVYAPDDLNWIQGLTCVHCTMLPGKVIDINANFDGTWHDCTYHPGTPDRTITASFSGTAVYVYFIVPNTVPWTTTFMNLSFSIDGTYFNQYEHTPDSSSTINYQVLVFHAPNLANTAHSIEMRATGPSDSILLFDYMAYTVGEVDAVPPPPSTSTTSNPPSTTTGPPSAQTQPPSSSAPNNPIPGSSTSAISGSGTGTSQRTILTSNTAAIPVTGSEASQDESGRSSAAHSTQQGGSNAGTSTTSLGPPSPTASSTQSDPEVVARGASPASPIGAIAGGVAGGLAILVVLFLLYRYIFRRRRRAAAKRKYTSEKMSKPKASGSAKLDLDAPAHAGVPSAPASALPQQSLSRSRSLMPTSFRGDGTDILRPPGAILQAVPPPIPQGAPSEISTSSAASSATPSRGPPTAYTTSTHTGVSTLRAQVTVLQEELLRLRGVEDEMHRLFIDPPPRYEE